MNFYYFDILRQASPLPVFLQVATLEVLLLVDLALHASLVLLGRIEQLFGSLVAHLVFLGFGLLLLLLLLLVFLLLVLLLLLLLLLLFLLILLLLLLIVATILLLVLALLQLVLRHSEVVARLVIGRIATEGTLVEVDSILEGSYGIAVLLAHGTHALSIPDIAHVVEVARFAKRIVGTNGIGTLVVFESRGVFLLHHIGIAQIVVCLKGRFLGQGFQIVGLGLVILPSSVGTVAKTHKVTGALSHDWRHQQAP